MMPWERITDFCSICIDGSADNVCYGQLHHRYNSPIPFQNLDQVILQIDDLYNRLGTPRAWEGFRGADALCPNAKKRLCKPCIDVQEIRNAKGEKATFWVVILRRQFNSWQGAIYWKEYQKEAMFNSVTDLLLLLAGALKDEIEKERAL